jgi:ferredoxin-type protein NapH
VPGKHKTSQLITVWFLPIIVIGGLFFPWLGLLVVAMMFFFLVLAYFQDRYWCWNLCPRGAFLDLAVSRVSLKSSLPRMFARTWFRWTVFVVLMSLMAGRLAGSGWTLPAIGAVFVGMCIATTIVALVLGVIAKPRGWCLICPMGTLQGVIGRRGRRNRMRS